MGLRGPGARPKRLKAEIQPQAWDDPKLPMWRRVVAFIEALPITAGEHAGKLLKLRPWQKAFVKATYQPTKNKRRVVRTAVLSLPRKNGKSCLVAALALAHLVGPAAEKRGQVYSAASDRPQAAIIYEEMKAIIQEVPWMDARCNCQDFYKKITDRETGSVYTAMSSDARKAHGLSPSFIVADEIAQWKNRALWDNLTSGTGARKEPLTVALGTQSADDENLMSELIDYGLQVQAGEVEDPTFHLTFYSAPEDADPWHPDTWKASNPALGDFRSLEEMKVAAGQAQRMPAREAVFRNLYLNQRIDANPRFIAPADWKACGGPVDPVDLYGRPCWGGLDLSSTTDLTALVLFFPDDGGAVLPYFWLPGAGLADREYQDRIPYRVWRDKGHLELTPGRAIDKGFIVKRLAETAANFDLKGIGFDRWRMADLQKLLEIEGLSLPLVPFGQGLRDMAPAVDSLETLVLSGEMAHGMNPILTMCAANVAIEHDAAGNRKFSKRRSNGRIDGMVALAMAIGLWAKEQPPAKPFIFDKSLPVFLY
ncbi:MAG: terminase large subunit [Enterobacterales bacterium]